MYKLLVTILFLTGFLIAGGQNCVVRSFRWVDPRDVKNMPMPMKDLSGKQLAVIRIESGQKGFEFDFGLAGEAVAAVEREGETWLWVPAGIQCVTIKNKQSGLSCNYPFSTKLDARAVYAMVLDDHNLKPTGEEKVETKWVYLLSSSLGADLFIDDYPAGKPPYDGSLTKGIHKIRIEEDSLKSEKTVEIKDGGPGVFQIEFRSDDKADLRGLGGPDQNPEFPGGYETMLKFLKANLKYPLSAQQSNTEGTVFVQFLVHATGRIQIICVLRGVGNGLDEEAVRVIKKMPDWIPAYSNGKACTGIFQIPVKFLLNKKPK